LEIFYKSFLFVKKKIRHEKFSMVGKDGGKMELVGNDRNGFFPAGVAALPASKATFHINVGKNFSGQLLCFPGGLAGSDIRESYMAFLNRQVIDLAARILA